MVVGILAFEAWAAELGVELPKSTGFEKAFVNIAKELLGGADSTEGAIVFTEQRDAVDELVAVLSNMATMGSLEYGANYLTRAPSSSPGGPPTELCIHLPTALALYQKYCHERGIEDRTNGSKSIRTMLNEKMSRGSYVVELDQRVRFGRSGQLRCVVIDQRRIPESLLIDDFPSRGRHEDPTKQNGPTP